MLRRPKKRFSVQLTNHMYWTTQIYRTFEGFRPSSTRQPSISNLVRTIAGGRQSASQGQWHHHAPHHYNNQRRTNAHNLLALHLQYGVSTNADTIPAASYFQNVSRAVRPTRPRRRRGALRRPPNATTETACRGRRRTGAVSVPAHR